MNLHDELRRHGAGASGEAADALRTDEVRATLGDRVRRGRRRRTLGGAGTVAGVALVAVGAWAVFPVPTHGTDPAGAGQSAHAGPYRYDVTGDSPTGEPEVLLRGDDAVACGDILDLTPGVTVHDPEALTRGLWAEAELTTLSETTGRKPPATPVPLDPDKPDGLMTGWDPNHPVWGVRLAGDALLMESVPLLMNGDTVMGSSSGTSTFNNLGGHGFASGGVAIPRLGYCEPSAESLTAEIGDPMDTVIVAQYWASTSSSPGGSQLLATIVFDPHVPANSDGLSDPTGPDMPAATSPSTPSASTSGP